MSDNDQDTQMQKAADTYCGGRIQLFLSLTAVVEEKKRLQSLELTSEEFQKAYRDFVTQEWKRYCQGLTDTRIMPIECYWWFLGFQGAGLSDRESNK